MSNMTDMNSSIDDEKKIPAGTKVVSVKEMRENDAWTIANKIPSKELMFRAGLGIYEMSNWRPPVAIVCGKGNNAGDGFVVADLMALNGIDCTIYLLEEKFSEDGKYYYDIAKSHGVKSVVFEEGMDFYKYGSVLDCLFGTGFSGQVRGKAKAAIDMINESGAYVVCADINSGLNGDTGMGTTFVKSHLTVSIGDYKYGHFLGLADQAMKEKVNIDIGIVEKPHE